MQDLHATLSSGSVVKDRYIVEELLGKGGFGAVYRVRDSRVKGNIFALKEVIDPNKEERERFAFECEVLKRLDNPALPRVYRVFEDNNNIRVYMLMDYVAGPNLEVLRQQQLGKRFSLPHAIKIMNPIMDAVGYLHKQEPPIIHRDIKPANIIVPDGGDDSVLVDFGIAKEYEQDSTTTAVRRCSPGYGAPEQYARGTNLRTDIYGLAATLYALLTGTIPTDALYRLTQMGSKNTDPLEPVQLLAPHVPQHVANAIHRAMAINSNDRFSSVEEFWREINAEPIAEPSVSIVPITSSKRVEDIPTRLVKPTRSNPPYRIVARSVEVTRDQRRRRVLPIFLSLFAVLAAIAGVTFGAGIFKGSSFGQVAHTVTATPKSTVRSTPTVVPTPKPTAIPTSKPPTATVGVTPTAVIPTTVPSTYPVLGRAYSGQVTNTFVSPSESAPIELRNIVQNNGIITSGYFYVAPGYGLQGSGNFTGTVSTNRTIKFTVQETNILPLLFVGTIESGGAMSGIYYAVNPDDSRNYTQGNGTWYTNPPSASSISIPQMHGLT